jgi:hypothetical protein
MVIKFLIFCSALKELGVQAEVIIGGFCKREVITALPETGWDS